MQLLPYEHFYIETPLTYSALTKKLEHITDTSFHLFEPFFSNKRYYGQITTNGFKIHPWISRHSRRLSLPILFPPAVAGNFLEGTNGEITVGLRFYLHWTALSGLLIWLLLYGLIFTVLLMGFFPNAMRIPDYALPACGISIALALVCTYGTMLSSFKWQVKRERQFFLELIEAYRVFERE